MFICILFYSIFSVASKHTRAICVGHCLFYFMTNLVPDAPGSVMRKWFVASGFQLLHAVVQEEIYKNRIDLSARMATQDLPTYQLNAPDTTRYNNISNRLQTLKKFPLLCETRKAHIPLNCISQRPPLLNIFLSLMAAATGGLQYNAPNVIRICGIR